MVAVGLLVLVAGCASEQAPERAADLVTSGPDTGDLLLSGIVHDGRSPVADAEADLVIWPADLDGSAEGDIVDTFTTPRARVGADGRFAIHLDPDRIPSRYFSAGADFVNFDIEVWWGRKTTTWSSTVSLVPGSRVWRTDGARSGDPVVDADFDLGSHRIALTSSLGEVEKGSLPVGELPKSGTPSG